MASLHSYLVYDFLTVYIGWRHGLYLVAGKLNGLIETIILTEDYQ